MAMNNPLSIPLNCSNASRQSRETLRNEVINQQTLFPFLMQFVLDPSSKLNIKACWVLELVLESNPQLIVPFLDSFCDLLPKPLDQSALRGISKCCYFTVKFLSLAPHQEQKIMESCLDWLISENTKVAAKAHTIRTLFELGKKNHSIYPDLKQILTDDYSKHSVAYQAVAREILKKIK